MGQQQLLLLVLGIIVVAFATTAAIQIFEDGAKKYEEDREHGKMLDLVTEIQAWKIKSEMFGGDAASPASDFSNFSLVSIGLKASGNPGTSPYVEFENIGCFRFFPTATELKIDALDENCTLGSSDKSIVVTGITHEDISWLYPTAP